MLFPNLGIGESVREADEIILPRQQPVAFQHGQQGIKQPSILRQDARPYPQVSDVRSLTEQTEHA